MRPLLRWTSLVGSAALLAVLGAANTHQRNFPVFLTAVLAVSVLTVAIYVATSRPRE
ncbi:MAG TPA: hypothetical protein VFR53_10115 [Methylomirabilota bacterium]|nr:hypothetical protein [Methylomirabilota bacterium]